VEEKVEDEKGRRTLHPSKLTWTIWLDLPFSFSFTLCVFFLVPLAAFWYSIETPSFCRLVEVVVMITNTLAVLEHQKQQEQLDPEE